MTLQSSVTMIKRIMETAHVGLDKVVAGDELKRIRDGFVTRNLVVEGFAGTRLSSPRRWFARRHQT